MNSQTRKLRTPLPVGRSGARPAEIATLVPLADPFSPFGPEDDWQTGLRLEFVENLGTTVRAEALSLGADAVWVHEQGSKKLSETARGKHWAAAASEFWASRQTAESKRLFVYRGPSIRLSFAFFHTALLPEAFDALAKYAIASSRRSTAKTTAAINRLTEFADHPRTESLLATLTDLRHILSVVDERSLRKALREEHQVDCGQSPLTTQGGLGALLDQLHAKIQGLRELFSDEAHRKVAAAELAYLLEYGDGELHQQALDRLSITSIASLQEKATATIRDRYQQEVFGGRAISISSFNSWLSSEKKNQEHEEASDVRKQFIANAIQYFVQEKNWKLMIKPEQGGDPLLCRITTNVMRNKRRFIVRPMVSTDARTSARATLPELVARK